MKYEYLKEFVPFPNDRSGKVNRGSAYEREKKIVVSRVRGTGLSTLFPSSCMH